MLSDELFSAFTNYVQSDLLIAFVRIISFINIEQACHKVGLCYLNLYTAHNFQTNNSKYHI